MKRRAHVIAGIITLALAVGFAVPAVVLGAQADTAPTVPPVAPPMAAPVTAVDVSPDALDASAAKGIEGITVFGRRPSQEVIRNFIKGYTAPAVYLHQIARWKAPICPKTVGLTPALNDFVNQRVRTVAALVGAGMQAKENCHPDILIVVTREPQALLDRIKKKASVLLGFHYGGRENNKKYGTMSRPIQAWYATATEDVNGTVTTDDPFATCDIFPNEPPVPGPCVSARASLFGDGLRSEFAAVTVIVDANKIVGMTIGALGDYITMLALSQTDSFDGCRNLPSISNLLAADCDEARKPAALTDTDMAYLKALYQMNPQFPFALQQEDLAKWMKRNLDGH